MNIAATHVATQIEQFGAVLTAARQNREAAQIGGSACVLSNFLYH